MRHLPLFLSLFAASSLSLGCSGTGGGSTSDDDDDTGTAFPNPGAVDVPLSTGPVSALPDLTIDVPLLEASTTAGNNEYYGIETIDTSDPQYQCAVQEGCFGGTGIRQVLRFSVGVPNIGNADVVVGDPADNPQDFEQSTCASHDFHYHYIGFANYEMSGPGGTAFGHKQAFCLMDYDDYGPAGPNAVGYDCAYQGISVGWQDIYGGYLDCQWVDVTDLPSGQYNLTVHVNAENKIPEAGPGPNIVTVPVLLP